MDAHIHGHATYMGGEVSAVVEIKPTEEKLVRFAAAAMLRRD